MLCILHVENKTKCLSFLLNNILHWAKCYFSPLTESSLSMITFAETFFQHDKNFYWKPILKIYVIILSFISCWLLLSLNLTQSSTQIVYCNSFPLKQSQIINFYDLFLKISNSSEICMWQWNCKVKPKILVVQFKFLLTFVSIST